MGHAAFAHPEPVYARTARALHAPSLDPETLTPMTSPAALPTPGDGAGPRRAHGRLRTLRHLVHGAAGPADPGRRGRPKRDPGTARPRSARGATAPAAGTPATPRSASASRPSPSTPAGRNRPGK